MKRRLIMFILCILMVGVIVMPASAESAATKAESYINVNSEGDCIVALTVTLHLEAAYESLTFPLPVDAANITMNGSSVRTVKTANATEVDVAKAINGLVGDFTVRLDYTIPNAVKVVPFENEEGKQTAYLQLELPLLSGFSFPVEQMSFVITMPGNVKWMPALTSVYRQSSIESDIPFKIDGTMITGNSIVPIQDHDSVLLTMVVPNDMFPSISTYIRVGNPELVPMLVCIGVAIVYWVLFCRTWPLIRRRNVIVPEGISAGELGCHLTAAGAAGAEDGDLVLLVHHHDHFVVIVGPGAVDQIVLIVDQGADEIVLSAQMQAVGFYEKVGYENLGELHYDQDCPHVTMKKKI